MSLPDGWHFVELGKVCKLPEKQVRPAEFSKYNYYVGLEHIEGSTGRVIEYKNVAKAKIKSSKFHFDTSSILYGKLRPYLNKVALPTVTGICSTDILPLKPAPELISREFLFYFLRNSSFVKTATEKSTGANLPRLSPEVLMSIPIPLPPLNVQYKIAQTLTKTDRLRQTRQQANHLTNKIIQSVFLKMFGDPSGNPRSWSIVTLGELIEEGPQNGLYKHSSFYGSGIPIVRINNFYAGVLSTSHLKRVRLTGDEIQTYRLDQHDILINRVNSPEFVGKCALIEHLSEDTVFESNMMRFRLKISLVTPEFVLNFLLTDHAKARIVSMSKRAVHQVSINQQDVKSIRLYLPPIDLQKKFSAVFHKIRDLIVRQHGNTAEINELFHSLMHKAFRGELRTAEINASLVK